MPAVARLARVGGVLEPTKRSGAAAAASATPVLRRDVQFSRDSGLTRLEENIRPIVDGNECSSPFAAPGRPV